MSGTLEKNMDPVVFFSYSIGLVKRVCSSVALYFPGVLYAAWSDWLRHCRKQC